MYTNAGIRSKPFSVQEVCGDCGGTDPGWASLNRGILLCNDCCSIHRSLGRHMSQVKSLRKANWSASLLAMIRALSSSGANGIWEHTLLDPGSNKGQRKKPHCRDPIHPNKAEFIKAKHQMLSFVHRPTKEDTQGQDGDISRQLHSSVRTANLETSLRLLSLGADPNYFHPEKGNCPLHVAAKCGHASQIEMLVIYGGDPGIEDSDGANPTDYARDAGHLELTNRLLELQYEVTDSFSYFISARKPDHSCGEHWLIPSDNNCWSEEAKYKLLRLPNNLFEELVCDVYDEIDRRETEAVWFEAVRDETSAACGVPFLPVNPEFSSTRNQGRQKLARLNCGEFKSLVCDVLTEAKRRADGILLPPVSAGKLVPSYQLELINNTGHPKHLNVDNSSTRPQSSGLSASASRTTKSGQPVSLIPDDDPLYDSVASEDDYSSLERRQKIQNHLQFLKRQKASLQEDYQEVNLPHIDEPSSMAAWMGIWKKEPGSNTASAAHVSMQEYIEMKRQLEASQAKIKDLQDNNVHMKAKLQELSSAVMSLKEENATLRCSPSSKMNESNFSPISPKKYPHFTQHMFSSTSDQNGDCVSPTQGSSRQQRPYSMFETRSPPGSPLHSLHSNTKGQVESCEFYSNENSYENLKNVENNVSCQSNCAMPSQEEVVRKTEVITRRIQELLRAAQDSRHEECVPCAEHISFAVKEMAGLFPKTDSSTELLHAVRQLVTSSNRLLSECRNHIASQLHTLDPGLVSQHVIQCAYDIAKAAKIVVTQFQ